MAGASSGRAGDFPDYLLMILLVPAVLISSFLAMISPIHRTAWRCC
jgi:hypothetical protein